MPKIRITAVARQPVDTAGIVATLVDLARRRAKEAKRPSRRKREDGRKP